MSNLSVPLRGKTLPINLSSKNYRTQVINFTQSWVQAYFDILWGNIGLGAWGIIFRDWFSNMEDMPLYPYYKKQNGVNRYTHLSGANFFYSLSGPIRVGCQKFTCNTLAWKKMDGKSLPKITI